MPTNHFVEPASSEQQVSCVIRAYIDATAQADSQRARTLFHSNAVMSGDLPGGVQTGSPEPFFEALENATKRPSETGYEGRVESVRVFGNSAIAELVEKNLSGYDFTNHFHLLQSGGAWLIVSKLSCATAINER